MKTKETGINLTQEFVFETDNLAAVDQALRMCWDVFLKFRKGTGSLPRFFADKPHFGFEDGKYENHHPADDPSVFSLDNKKFYVIDSCRTYGGVTFMHSLSEHGNADEASQAAYKLRKPLVPTRKWVGTVMNWLQSSVDKKRGMALRNADELVEEALKQFQLVEKTCDFYTEFADAMIDGDGSSRPGYRLSCRNDYLDLSLVWIYYSK